MKQASAQKEQRMLTENIRTLIPSMAVPTIIAQLITTIYNLVDTYFVSTIGTYATAAVGVNSSLERMITIIGSLIGAGACSYISRLLGAKRKEQADRVLSTSFFTGLALGIIFMLVCRMMMGNLVDMLGATEECRQYSIQYATYVLYAAPFMIGSFILNMCLRSEGSAMYAMIGIGFGGILNCFLDPLFIYGLDLGVAGASMATAISKFISFCILITPYIRRRTSVRIAITKIKFVFNDVKEVVLIGSSSFFRSLLTVIASILINNIAGMYSTSVLAAISVSNRVMEFPFAIILGFGQGYQPVVGFNWGAKAWKRVKESYTFSCLVSIFGGIIIGLLIFVLAQPIVHIFNSEADAEVLSIGILCIRLQCIALPLHALNSIVNMYYAGTGRAGRALVINISRQGYCLWPTLFIAPIFLGVYGIASAQAIADLLSMVVVIPFAIMALKELNRKLAQSDEAAAEKEAAS